MLAKKTATSFEENSKQVTAFFVKLEERFISA